jgi:triphosphoribosyl-dephospho-CoA synthase
MTGLPLSLGQCAALACLLEATAPKPGNVHRGADFDDMTYADLLAGGLAIAPAIDRAAGQSVGQTVLQAVHATRCLVGKNTNLGTILLLAPLAAVPRQRPLRDGVRDVLASLGPDDARAVYDAIRAARPGGLGTVPQYDVSGPAPDDLLQAMRLAAPRDLVARQYVENFALVLDGVVPELQHALRAGWPLLQGIVFAYLRMLSAFPDSLVARKCGPHIAQRVSDQAAAVLDAGEPGSPAYAQRLAEFDFWLRSDGHRRNPGTTADLIAAGLFALLRDGLLAFPLKL